MAPADDQQDARFEDAPISDRPLRLRAETAEDLGVISALLQDAVARAADVRWMRTKRRLAVLVNRFRWEDREKAETARRPYERVRSALTLDDVLSVRARGIAPEAGDAVISILSLAFEPGEDGAGTVVLALAGGGDIAVEVECLDATLADLTRPWVAKAQKAPGHDA